MGYELRRKHTTDETFSPTVEEWFNYSFSLPNKDFSIDAWDDRSGETAFYWDLNFGMILGSAAYSGFNNLSAYFFLRRMMTAKVLVTSPLVWGLVAAVVVGTIAGAGAEPEWTASMEVARSQAQSHYDWQPRGPRTAEDFQTTY